MTRIEKLAIGRICRQERDIVKLLFTTEAKEIHGSVCLNRARGMRHWGAFDTFNPYVLHLKEIAEARMGLGYFYVVPHVNMLAK
ncbi:MAG: hypothetical protein ACTH8J_14445 [Specibacter sp.]